MEKSCGCKGIRSCRLCEECETGPLHSDKENVTLSLYNFCLDCQRAWSTKNDMSCGFPSDSAVEKQRVDDRCAAETQEASRSCPNICDHTCQSPINFSGVSVIRNFVTKDEEAALCEAIYGTDFVNSQSGRRKQDFGPKVNFKRKKLKLAAFTGLPSYSRFLYDRMKQRTELSDFDPVELCNLEYCSERGAHIDPHFDDAWLWGERLVTLNLISDSTLSFTSDKLPSSEVRVPMPLLSLVIVEGAARHCWKHGISRGDITGRRLAMTFRELSDEFRSGGQKEDEGEQLLKLALTFEGIAVGGS
ncbi:hypothetical protein EGW08_002460 [Elysia chlorotica]|uniref:Fe2OG dioxygenase domain-containing protein n=1 Tax=Elysia chlorotica TaxID=188477 RepID=A0A433U7H7_ELYCH|nr:hypothetical protein EGW08_002460 [Elysia chlorotica]